MNQYYQKEGKVYFRFNYNTELISEIKKIDGRWYHPETKEWSIPNTILNGSAIKNLIENFNFKQLSSEGNIKPYLTPETSLEIIKTYREIIQTLGLKFNLRDYQFRGVDLMNHFHDCINGDDMGLGKTLQAIYSVESLNNFPCLVVCPSSVKYHWFKYWSESNPNRTVSIIEAGSKLNNFDTDVVIMNYDNLSKKVKEEKGDEEIERVVLKYEELEREWGCLICDEIHYVKNSKSNRSKSVRKIAKNSKRRIGLTGTLVEKKPSEIIHPLMVINKFTPNFRNWKFFVDRYCDAKMTRFGMDVSGSSNELELNRILRGTCYIRREKKEVYSELPDRQDSIVNIEIENLRKYIMAEDDFLSYVTKNFTEERALKAFNAEFLVQRNELRQLSVRYKLKGIIEWLENYSESTSEKLVVFGVHREPLTKLAVQFDCDVIDGSIGSWEKQTIVNDFTKNKKQFIFGNIQAMGTGTDGLQHAASNMAIIELPDNSSKLDQAIARIERIGSKIEGTGQKLNIYYLLSEDTIDMPMWYATEEERKIVEAVNKGVRVEPKKFDDLVINKMLEKRRV